MLLRIQSCGHDYEALSYTANVPFFILDMINLRSIDINDTDSVEGGCLLENCTSGSRRRVVHMPFQEGFILRLA